jgi:hypothetical protein
MTRGAGRGRQSSRAQTESAGVLGWPKLDDDFMLSGQRVLIEQHKCGVNDQTRIKYVDDY